MRPSCPQGSHCLVLETEAPDNWARQCVSREAGLYNATFPSHCLPPSQTYIPNSLCKEVTRYCFKRENLALDQVLLRSTFFWGPLKEKVRACGGWATHTTVTSYHSPSLGRNYQGEQREQAGTFPADLWSHLSPLKMGARFIWKPLCQAGRS